MAQHYVDPIRSYRKAQDVMSRKGRRGLRAAPRDLAVRLGWNLYLIASTGDESPPWYGVRLHDTFVVKFHRPTEEGITAVSFETGGWNTVTTLNTIQKYSPDCIGVSGRNIHSSKREGPIFVRLNEGSDVDLSREPGSGATFRVPNIYE